MLHRPVELAVISGQSIAGQNPPLSAIVRKRPNSGRGCCIGATGSIDLTETPRWQAGCCRTSRGSARKRPPAALSTALASLVEIDAQSSTCRSGGRPLLDCYDRSLRVLARWALKSMLFMSWLFWLDPRKQHYCPAFRAARTRTSIGLGRGRLKMCHRTPPGSKRLARMGCPFIVYRKRTWAPLAVASRQQTYR